jgi:cephalosporin hydroxylase
VIETGTLYGGSALFLAHMMDLLGKGEIVTIDVNPGERPRPEHPRITYLTGSSIDPEIVAQAAERARAAETVLVLLDSDHDRKHVLKELAAYAPLVTPGSYLVVEDTNINGHPTRPDGRPGPFEAVEEFMESNDDFTIDHEREKFLVTFNPSGFLRRK